MSSLLSHYDAATTMLQVSAKHSVLYDVQKAQFWSHQAKEPFSS